MSVPKPSWRWLLPALVLPLSGCNTILLNAPGDIAAQQGDLIRIATVLMLLIIVPVMALTVLFAWRYRAGNAQARYRPEWNHSTQLELMIWSAPLLIIIALGAITWISTHTLDPYRPLDRIDADRAVQDDTPTLVVEVVAMDWKWLFVYPEQGIATLNELAAPVDMPIKFKITASSVMNSFYIPALAGQIYAMAGMETQLHAVMNQPGAYPGFSANYSGAGFSGMRFTFHGLSQDGFDAWVNEVRASQDVLDRQQYLVLERPSEREPVRYFGRVDPALYHAILNRCVDPEKMCMDEMMRIDAGHGGGHGGSHGAQAGHAASQADAHQDHPAHAPAAGGTGHGDHADEAAGHDMPSDDAAQAADTAPAVAQPTARRPAMPEPPHALAEPISFFAPMDEHTLSLPFHGQASREVAF